MSIIGFRCFPDGFSYLVLDGTQSSPKLIAHKRLTFPKDLKWGAKLSWLRKQLIEILNEHDIHGAGIKSAETMSQNKSLPRSEVEGVTKETVYSHLGHECVARIKSQLKRDIADFNGPARYLERVLTATALGHLNTPVFQDATLAAVAELEE